MRSFFLPSIVSHEVVATTDERFARHTVNTSKFMIGVELPPYLSIGYKVVKIRTY